MMLSIKVVVVVAVLSTISLFFVGAILLKVFQLPELNYLYAGAGAGAAAASSSSDLLNVVVSWLRPPYLYLVINCIIITILATSKLQSKFDHYAFPPPQPLKTQQLSSSFHHFSFSQQPPVKSTPVYGGGVANTITESWTEKMKLDSTVFDQSKQQDVKAAAKDFYQAAEDHDYASKLVLLNSNKLNTNRAPATESEFSKPPASSRFGHRKVVKTTPEGGKTLRVSSKPKRQETLESTWKTITDGRPMPLTRHLRKSDTWETTTTTTTNHPTNDHATDVKMTKSETFNDCSSSSININRKKKSQSTLLACSSGSAGKLKKDPSLGQDELNKRVEAFITKFNEDMRLQRQESINQYMEMINRGAAP